MEVLSCNSFNMLHIVKREKSPLQGLLCAAALHPPFKRGRGYNLRV